MFHYLVSNLKNKDENNKTDVSITVLKQNGFKNIFILQENISWGLSRKNRQNKKKRGI